MYGLFAPLLGQQAAVISRKGGPRIASDLAGIVNIDLETNGKSERTWAEADNADLVVAVCGKTGTVQQIESVLGMLGPVSAARQKPVIIVGWFGGQLHDFLRRELPASLDKRIIRSVGEVNFATPHTDWPQHTSELASQLALAIHHILATPA